MSSFGERLRKLRRDRNVTQTQLADYLEIKGAAVGKYETNRNAYPNIKTLVKIADYFNVTTDYLLRGTQSEEGVPVVVNSVDSDKKKEEKPPLSPELTELIRIYEGLRGRDRLKLTYFALDLEEAAKNEDEPK